MSFTFTLPKYRYFKNKTGTRYYKYNSWTQPVLTSNGTMGGNSFACSASNWELASTGTIAEPYAAFDNNPNTYWRCGKGITTGWFQFYNPTPIKVSSIKWGYFYSYPLGGNVQGSNDGSNWEMLSVWDNNTEGDFIIQVNSDNFYKYYRINCDGVNLDTFHCVQFTITAVVTIYHEVSSTDSYDFIETYTYEEEVSSSDDYDYIEITPQSYSVIKEVERYFKNVTRYYKYAEQTWVQPKLTSNGLVGISEFATEASSERDIRLAYRAFDGSNLDSEVDCWHTMRGQIGWLVWYVKNPIKISSLTIYNRPMWDNKATTVNSIKEWELQVSDDGVTWRTIKNGTNSNNDAQSGWDITIESSVQVYSNYWRLNIHSSNGTDLCVGEIKINAIANIPYEVSANDDYDYVETLAEETTSDDYDFTETTEKFYKVEWVNPILCSITVMTDAPIRNDFITINGSVLKTDSNGKVVLRCNYGSPEVFYIRYGNWANVVVIDPRKNNVIITLKQ